MRLLNLLHCKASSQRGHLQSPAEGWKSCFSLWGTDASPSPREKNHKALEMPTPLRPFQLHSTGKTKGMPS